MHPARSGARVLRSGRGCGCARRASLLRGIEGGPSGGPYQARPGPSPRRARCSRWSHWSRQNGPAQYCQHAHTRTLASNERCCGCLEKARVPRRAQAARVPARATPGARSVRGARHTPAMGAVGTLRRSPANKRRVLAALFAVWECVAGTADSAKWEQPESKLSDAVSLPCCVPESRGRRGPLPRYECGRPGRGGSHATLPQGELRWRKKLGRGCVHFTFLRLLLLAALSEVPH